MGIRKSKTLTNLPVLPSPDEIRNRIIEQMAIRDEARRRIYLKDLFEFNRKVLHIESGVAADAEGQEKRRVPLGEFHRKLCGFVMDKTKRRKLILIPRGHLKSTLVTVGYSLLRIAEDPTIRILIMNATADLAKSFLGQIKKHLQFNDTFRELYGEMDKNASKWTEDKITVQKLAEGEAFRSKEPTVTAWGAGGSLTSQHYDLIIEDDLVNRENIGTKEQIEKVITTYKDSLDLLEPGGELIVIGTRWNDGDLYGWIMDPTNGISDKFDVMVYSAAQHNDLEKGDILWPEKYSRDYLRHLRIEKGSSEFSAQYFNDPVPPDSAIFRRTDFRYYITNDIAGKVLNRFTFVDPALSTSKESDFTAIVTVGVDMYNNVFILDVFRKQVRPSDLVKKLFDVDEEYQPLRIFLEEVANQKVIRPFAEQIMKERNHHLPIHEVKPGFRETKEMRITGLQSWYERHQIFHKEGLENIDHLEDELLRFPRGRHDDVIDAMSYFPGNIYAPKRHAGEEDEKRRTKYLY